MELLIKINTAEAMSLAEAEELTKQSQARHVAPGELAAQFIKDGLRKIREESPEVLETEARP